MNQFKYIQLLYLFNTNPIKREGLCVMVLVRTTNMKQQFYHGCDRLQTSLSSDVSIESTNICREREPSQIELNQQSLQGEMESQQSMLLDPLPMCRGQRVELLGTHNGSSVCGGVINLSLCIC